MELFECGEILLADSESQKNQIWKLRRAIAESVKSNSIYKEEDTVVPRAELAKLFTNSYRYIKFAIANQFYNISDKSLGYIKNDSWDKYVGKDHGVALCLCCCQTQLIQMNIWLGQVINSF